MPRPNPAKCSSERPEQSAVAPTPARHVHSSAL